MSNFNKIERSVARFLSRFPLAKQFAKSTYSRLAYLRHKKEYKYRTNFKIDVLGKTEPNSFFGYYDKSPESASGNVLTYVTKGDTTKEPQSGQRCYLQVFDRADTLCLEIPIKAFNWQQGSRAHWLTDDLFCFNDFDDQKNIYVTRVFSVEKKAEIKSFSRPVQDSYGTDYLISLNYRRLMALRPDYGYSNLPALSEAELLDHTNDGLWVIDYVTGASDLAVSINKVCAIKPHDDFSRAMHKLNHVMISPDGSKVIFIHRYLLGGQRFDRLFLMYKDGYELTLLSDFGIVSHCFWVDNETVLGYMSGPSNENAYWLIDVHTGEFVEFNSVALGKYGDGHPHVHGDWFVTDTYPDKSRMQHLLLCNLKTNEIKVLGEFYHGFEFDGQSRCDLHPRFSPDGGSVFFDSVFDGKRHLYRMDLKKPLIQQGKGSIS